MTDSRFTGQDLAMLYHHGMAGVISTAERAAQKRVIDIWKSDDTKRKKLTAFNEHFDLTHVALDTGHINRNYSELLPGIIPSGIEEESPVDAASEDLEQIGEELARDIATHFEEELMRLVKCSTLSKQQFVILVLLWEDPGAHGTGRRELGEHQVAECFDITILQVRSHHARARQLIEKAGFTAGLTDYPSADSGLDAEERRSLLDERLQSSTSSRA